MRTLIAPLFVAVSLSACQLPSPSGAGGGGAGGGGDVQLSDDAGAPVSWYRDVLPITQSSCVDCHASGGIAPFSLETYAQAKPMAFAMANAAHNRTMPPWMPDQACNRYTDERRLSDAQIDVLMRWATQGAPEGDPAEAPPAPDAGQGLSRVDKTLQMNAPYTPNGAITDDYHCFVIDPALTADKFVVGYEVVPGSRRQVHHVIMYTGARADAVARDAQQAGDGYTCFGGPDVDNPDMIGGWVPGSASVNYPTGTGIKLQANRVLIMQVHYNLSNGPPEPDQTTVKLQFATGAVTPAILTPLADFSFVIPANAMGYTPPTQPYSYTMPFGATVYGVLPHMHTRGKRIQVRSTQGCLVDIPRWDFHWQQQYFFQTPMRLNAGSTLSLTCTWDNPTSSTVRWGEGTDDEMCINYFYYTL